MPRYPKGNTPGPGRPPGSRNRVTVLLEQLGAEGAEKVVRAVQAKAENGDLWAASILLARLWPRQRHQAVTLDLPAVETPAGLVQAQAAVVAAMARGDLTPDEAASVGAVLETQRRAIETNDHEHRIKELEATRRERDKDLVLP